MSITYLLILPSNSIDHSTLQQSFVDDLTLVKGAVSSRVSSLARAVVRNSSALPMAAGGFGRTRTSGRAGLWSASAACTFSFWDLYFGRQ
jgi:hypothetical protein